MLSDVASDMNAGIMLFTETHLNDQILDAEVQIKNFDLYRTDRQGYRNGGLIIYSKTDLNLGITVKQSLLDDSVVSRFVCLQTDHKNGGL